MVYSLLGKFRPSKIIGRGGGGAPHIIFYHLLFCKNVYFLNIFISLEVFRNSYLQNEAVNELKDNFICQEATRVSLN